MEYPKEQLFQSTNLNDYKYRIAVCGTRYWANKRFFHDELLAYLSSFNEPVIFISGAAATGADDLIIRWCMKFRYPYVAMAADWNTYGKRAGYLRNEQIAKVATHVLAFYDGSSRGTKHMLTIAETNHLSVKTILI